MMIGGLVSCLLTGPIAAVAFLGRKETLWIASFLFIVANVIMMATSSIGGLYVGRLLLGVANGLYVTFSQLYVQECSPARYRGLLISCLQIWTSAGGLVGTIVDNSTEAIDGRQAYMIPMSFMYIIPAIISIGLFFIPESPRWLLQHARGDQARAALRWLRPYGEAELEAEFCDMQDALKAHAEAEKGAAFMDMFKNPVNRRRTALAVCVVLVQNTSGAFYMICRRPHLSTWRTRELGMAF